MVRIVPIEGIRALAEIRRDVVADPADYRHGDRHPERRNPAGPAREGAGLSLRVEPVGERIAPAHRDVDGPLFEELLDRHGPTRCVTTYR